MRVELIRMTRSFKMWYIQFDPPLERISSSRSRAFEGRAEKFRLFQPHADFDSVLTYRLHPACREQNKAFYQIPPLFFCEHLEVVWAQHTPCVSSLYKSVYARVPPNVGAILHGRRTAEVSGSDVLNLPLTVFLAEAKPTVSGSSSLDHRHFRQPPTDLVSLLASTSEPFWPSSNQQLRDR